MEHRPESLKRMRGWARTVGGGVWMRDDNGGGDAEFGQRIGGLKKIGGRVICCMPV